MHKLLLNEAVAKSPNWLQVFSEHALGFTERDKVIIVDGQTGRRVDSRAGGLRRLFRWDLRF